MYEQCILFLLLFAYAIGQKNVASSTWHNQQLQLGAKCDFIGTLIILMCCQIQSIIFFRFLFLDSWVNYHCNYTIITHAYHVDCSNLIGLYYLLWVWLKNSFSYKWIQFSNHKTFFAFQMAAATTTYLTILWSFHFWISNLHIVCNCLNLYCMFFFVFLGHLQFFSWLTHFMLG